jgi:hypothetical protein
MTTTENVSLNSGYKDILVSYQGGGYDGCFWEWNYFIFDSDGQFHDVGSSGYKAITEVADALELLSNLTKDTYITDLNDHDSILTFSRDTNEGHVIRVTQKVNDLYGEDKMFFECDCCKEEVHSGIPEGLRGCGGIAMCYSEKVCEGCYYTNTCGECGTYHSEMDQAMLCCVVEG